MDFRRRAARVAPPRLSLEMELYLCRAHTRLVRTIGSPSHSRITFAV